MRLDVVMWGGFCLLLWACLAGWQPASFGFGVVAAIMALLVRKMTSDPYPSDQRHRLNPVVWLRFVVFFVTQSVKGGIDTSRLALGPAPAINDGFIDYHSSLPSGSPRAMLTQVISLMPGTLSVELRGAAILVHVLDIESDTLAELQRCEKQVARLFHLENAA